MEPAAGYIEKNKKSWNTRTEAHLKSAFYDLDGFLKGKSSLNEIELRLLGNIRGKSILHLQCHFGQDSISLSREGARVTGVDLSDKAIATAQDLAGQMKLDAQFICCDIYDLPKYLDEQFDIVFTSYGVLAWLPDLEKWANIISRFLKPGGKLVLVEFHPVVWMFDDNFDKVIYNYAYSAPIVELESGTYADRDAEITLESIVWNHGIGEVVNSLIKCGLNIVSLDELDYSPYNCFNHTIEFEPGKFRIQHLENFIPIVFSIEAKKNK